jgi:hypothetical protein
MSSKTIPQSALHSRRSCHICRTMHRLFEWDALCPIVNQLLRHLQKAFAVQMQLTACVFRMQLALVLKMCELIC